MKQITWIKILSKRYGGAIYGEKVRKALLGAYEVEVKEIPSGKLGWKYLKPFEWFFHLWKIKGERDLWVRDDIYAIAFQCLAKTKGTNLSVIYHIDASVFPFALRPFHWLLERIFYFNLRKSDAILTIADFWRLHFLEAGYQRVYKISPAFDLSQFNISEEEIVSFKEKHQLEEKPIIYLGNCQKAKGAVESYQALKGLDVFLVTSGEEQVKIPALNLNLSYREYLILLKACSVVITMSQFKEGWCMTAHEAMLLKSPVIGSGQGGMKELLEGGKQIICQDFGQLKEKVEFLLNNPGKRQEMAEAGFNFAQNFTLDRFQKEWLELVKNVIR